MNENLFVTLEGTRVGDGSVPLSEFLTAMQGVQDAMRLMVEHLGNRHRGPGQPPKWVREQSTLRLSGTHVGSYMAELSLDPPPNAQGYLQYFGLQAFDALRNWDGSADSLPKEVAARLYEIPHSLSEDVSLWLGRSGNVRNVEIKRRRLPQMVSSDSERALVHGWLKEVNWYKGTAQLHHHGNKYVQLRFDSELDTEMLELANGFVEIRGRGRLNAKGEWISIEVELLTAARGWRDPLDLESILNDPELRVFDPENTVRATEPFDVDDFLDTIHEARDAHREESLD